MTNRSAGEAVLDKEVRRLLEVAEEVPLEDLPEPVRTYVGYALGTVARGRLTFDEIRPYCAVEGIRFLDAGCAYGGFLAAAAEAGAREVVGVDVDERLLRIARPYLSAFGIPHRIEKGDVTDRRFLEQFGHFDLITCNDVVEHVDSVPRCIESLASALAEGGCLYIAAPNRMSPEFIRKDPHFQFFGIVLLPPPSARRYHFLKTAWPHYDVGDYFELELHQGLLERHGLEVEVINVPSGSERERVEALAAEIREIEATAASFADPKLPGDLIGEIREAVTRLARRFDSRLERVRHLEASGHPEAAVAAAAEIVRDYALPVWHIVARKPEKRGRKEEAGFFARLRRALGGTKERS